MLELDLVLLPFLDKVYPTLDAEYQRLYQQLLEEQDQDLFSWFLGRKDPDCIELLRIVELIRDHSRQAS